MCLLICLFFVRFVGVSVGSPGCSFAWFVGILLFGVVGGRYLTLWEIGWFWSVFVVVGQVLDLLMFLCVVECCSVPCARFGGIWRRLLVLTGCLAFFRVVVLVCG